MQDTDREQCVRLLLQQMREKLANTSPETQRDTESSILFLSGVVNTLTRTGVLSLPELVAAE